MNQSWIRPLPGHESEYFVHIRSGGAGTALRAGDGTRNDGPGALTFCFSLCAYPQVRRPRASPTAQSKVVSKATWSQLNPTFFYSHRMFQFSFDRNLRATPTMRTITHLLDTWKPHSTHSDVVIHAMMFLYAWTVARWARLEPPTLLAFFRFMHNFCADAAKPGGTPPEPYVAHVRLHGMAMRAATLPPALRELVAGGDSGRTGFWRAYGELKQDLITSTTLRRADVPLVVFRVLGFSCPTEGFSVPVIPSVSAGAKEADGGRHEEGSEGGTGEDGPGHGGVTQCDGGWVAGPPVVVSTTPPALTTMPRQMTPPPMSW